MPVSLLRPAGTTHVSAVDLSFMPRRKDLRPINETRVNGKFTAETGARLLRRRAALASAAVQRSKGFPILSRARYFSALSRALKVQVAPCARCAVLLKALHLLEQDNAAILARVSTLTKAEQKLIS